MNDWATDIQIKNCKIGKRHKFKAGDGFIFTGLIQGIITFNRNNRKFLKIEIVPNKLYFYIGISLSGNLGYFEILEEITIITVYI